MKLPDALPAIYAGSELIPVPNSPFVKLARRNDRPLAYLISVETFMREYWFVRDWFFADSGLVGLGCCTFASNGETWLIIQGQAQKSIVSYIEPALTEHSHKVFCSINKPTPYAEYVFAIEDNLSELMPEFLPWYACQWRSLVDGDNGGGGLAYEYEATAFDPYFEVLWTEWYPPLDNDEIPI